VGRAGTRRTCGVRGSGEGRLSATTGAPGATRSRPLRRTREGACAEAVSDQLLVLWCALCVDRNGNATHRLVKPVTRGRPHPWPARRRSAIVPGRWSG